MALANIELIEREGLLGRSRELEAIIATLLGDVQSHPAIAATRSFGVMAGIALSPWLDAYAVADEMIARGQIARVLPGNTIQLSPPLTANGAQVAEFLGVLADVAEGPWGRG